MVRALDRAFVSGYEYPHQFPSVLFGMLGSTIPVSVLGIRYAMSVEPFWKPDQYSEFMPSMPYRLSRRWHSPHRRHALW